MKQVKKNLYVDALALVPEKKSGVGVTLENTLEQLLKNPDLKGWQVYLVVPLGKAQHLKKYEADNVHVKTIYLPPHGLVALSVIKFMPPIDWFLGSGVYLFPNYRNWSIWRSRSVTYVYDISYIKHPETVQARNQKYLQRFMPSWVKRTDRLVTISTQVKYEIEKFLGLNETNIDVVPCGVDTKAFYKRNAKDVESVKNHYGIADDHYFLFVGNIEPRKNLPKLLDAYSLLPDAIQAKYALILVGGDGWQNEEVYQKLEKLQAAKRHVYRLSDYVATADLPALYSGATMLIHPAIYEGFGITPLEAMACGTPVVVSDIPVIHEVVKDAGVYFDPYDAGSIVDAIKKTLKDDSLVTANIKKGLVLADQFSWQKSAQGLLRVISFEQQQGPHRHPWLTRLKFIYQTIDHKILQLLGERAHTPYVPPAAETLKQLRESIFKDFVAEEPSDIQLITKRLYLGAKHLASGLLKGVYHRLKGAES